MSILRNGPSGCRVARRWATWIEKPTSLGLPFLAAIVPKTGIGGLTLGGGVGWQIRKYGMTIDNLLSCQIVTTDGSVLTASASEHEDLFWALRGGGGNFGVVISFEFQARSVHTVLGAQS
jgi:FAD/FMN-containing dehydrogenase